jgi:hypothetical protein
MGPPLTKNSQFQMGDEILEGVLPKNQHTQRKLLNFKF